MHINYTHGVIITKNFIGISHQNERETKTVIMCNTTEVVDR